MAIGGREVGDARITDDSSRTARSGSTASRNCCHAPVANLRMMRIIRTPFLAMDGRLSGPSPMKRDDGEYAEATDFITKEA
jgi:hypothetical protein